MLAVFSSQRSCRNFSIESGPCALDDLGHGGGGADVHVLRHRLLDEFPDGLEELALAAGEARGGGVHAR